MGAGKGEELKMRLEGRAQQLTQDLISPVEECGLPWRDRGRAPQEVGLGEGDIIGFVF